MKKEKSFIKAGVILVVSGFVVKVLGAVYRIPLTRMLGAAQMGRYSAVFSLFMPFFSIATAGIVPCVSHYTAKAEKDGFSQVKNTAYRLYTLQAFCMALCFVLFGRFYSQMQGDSIFFYGSAVLAPAIIFAAAENICKGVTQGRMNMLPTASANVVESVLKTALGLAGVYFEGKTAAD
ncbi:MAG: oligosaccharide flippase family protein, partial [Oscillospiraceae bacterium]|nr:oligosaccharide flippase family protein [Oscillospiraceae bacterium]